MKILIGADTYAPDVNGAARFTQRLAAGLHWRGHDVHVVAPSPIGAPRVERLDGVTVHRLRSHRLPGHDTFRVCLPPLVARDVARIVTRVGPDVVHTQAHLVLGRCLAGPVARAGLPFVATNHLMPENLLDQGRVPHALRPAAARWMWRDLARVVSGADVVTAPTPRAVQLLVDRAGLTHARAVSCGIDPTPYARAAARARRHPAPVPTVLFVGRLDPEKRVGDLIRAFAALPADCAARLEIVGDGMQGSTWRDLARGLGVGERVTFRGFVSEAELAQAYGRADVFVMPSIAELQSLVTLEAMSAHTPVVAADAMALPHLVHPGENGFLYPPGDVAALRDHLATLLRDPALRERLGARSAQLVGEHALGATLAEFEAIYAEAIGRRGRPAWRAAA
ncbi:glycosyltransferase [Agilicoccus flavus]|uniref:glycosyltransferase n=1 Tax=Agilicoccus flavus TaxID=2775968 RepID=UPI001CF6828F|nr:glycosyltransferase [Agilicoccus flavus]